MEKQDYVWVFNPLSREQLTHALTKKTKKLKGPESRVLELLIANQGTVVSKQAILAHAWGERIVTDASLTQSISQIRLALGDNGREQKVIKTMPNAGYLLFDNIIELTHDSKSYEDNLEDPLSTLPISPSLNDESSQPSEITGNLFERYNAAHLSKVILFVVALIQATSLLYKINTRIQLPAENWEQGHSQGVTYLYSPNPVSKQLYQYIHQNSKLLDKSKLSMLLITANISEYYISCIYQHSENMQHRVKNLTFSLQESHYFIRDTIHEICQ